MTKGISGNNRISKCDCYAECITEDIHKMLRDERLLLRETIWRSTSRGKCNLVLYSLETCTQGWLLSKCWHAATSSVQNDNELSFNETNRQTIRVTLYVSSLYLSSQSCLKREVGSGCKTGGREMKRKKNERSRERERETENEIPLMFPRYNTSQSQLKGFVKNA